MSNEQSESIEELVGTIRTIMGEIFGGDASPPEPPKYTWIAIPMINKNIAIVHGARLFEDQDDAMAFAEELAMARPSTEDEEISVVLYLAQSVIVARTQEDRDARDKADADADPSKGLKVKIKIGGDDA